MTFGIIGDSGLVYENARRQGKLAIAAREFMSSFPLLNLDADNRGIYTLWLSVRPSVLVTTPDAARQVLNGKETMKKGPVYDIIRQFFGNGLVTSHSERWHKHRKLLTPGFHRKFLDSASPIITSQGRILTSVLEREASKSTDRSIKSIVEFIFAATLDVLCESSMGIQLESQSNPESSINVAIRGIFEVMVHYVMTPWMWIKPLFDNSPFGRAALKHVAYFNDFCEKVISNRMDGMKDKMSDNNNANLDGARDREPLIDVLLREHLRNPKDFTLDDVRDETNIFVAAGHDTTGWAVSYTLYLLGHHPHVQEKAQREIDAVYRDIINDDHELTPETIKHFPYVEAIFKESLRLYTPIPCITRVATEETGVCGYHIPKGTEMIIPLFMLHRDEKYWRQPEKFIPERFMQQLAHPYCYIPFSAGPRNCIGQKYAMLQSKSFLIQILRTFTIESITPPECIATYVAPVAVSSQPIHIKFHRRQ